MLGAPKKNPVSRGRDRAAHSSDYRAERTPNGIAQLPLRI